MFKFFLKIPGNSGSKIIEAVACATNGLQNHSERWGHEIANQIEHAKTGEFIFHPETRKLDKIPDEESRNVRIFFQIPERRKKFFIFGESTEKWKRVLNFNLILKLSALSQLYNQIMLEVDYKIFMGELDLDGNILWHYLFSPFDPNYEYVRLQVENFVIKFLECLDE